MNITMKQLYRSALVLCLGLWCGGTVHANQLTCERLVMTDAYRNARINHEDTTLARPHWRRIFGSHQPAVATGYAFLMYLIEKGGVADVKSIVEDVARSTGRSVNVVYQAFNKLRNDAVVVSERGGSRYDVLITDEGLIKTEAFINALRMIPPPRPRTRRR